MICNPKTDSKSEFGGPNTAEERERSVRGASEAFRPSLCPRVAQVESSSLPMCATRGGHMVAAGWLLRPSLEIF